MSQEKQSAVPAGAADATNGVVDGKGAHEPVILMLQQDDDGGDPDLTQPQAIDLTTTSSAHLEALQTLQKGHEHLPSSSISTHPTSNAPSPQNRASHNNDDSTAHVAHDASVVHVTMSPQGSTTKNGASVDVDADADADVAAAALEDLEYGQVTPQASLIVRPVTTTTTTPPSTPPLATTTTKLTASVVQHSSQHRILPFAGGILSPSHKLDDTVIPRNIPPENTSTMVFGLASKGDSAAKRRLMAHHTALTQYEADLTSKDRAKQKDAVRRHLAERVKVDWTWEWPKRDGDTSSSSSIFKREISNPDQKWKERDEWFTNASDSDQETKKPSLKELTAGPTSPGGNSKNPFRFNSPDAVGESLRRSELERKIRRKKRLAEEMAWNDGTKCFVQRRDAWTCARRAHPRQQPRAKSTHIRRTSGSLSGGEDGSSTALDSEDIEIDEWEDDTLIPIAGPILPPTNHMRASITPSAYNTIYDKVILQQITPSCPINLKDITRSCVAGWKRDGEWPPKQTILEQAVAKKRTRRRLSVAGILGLDKIGQDKTPKADKEKEANINIEEGLKSPGMGTIKRSLQRVLGLGKDHTAKEPSKESVKEPQQQQQPPEQHHTNNNNDNGASNVQQEK